MGFCEWFSHAKIGCFLVKPAVVGCTSLGYMQAMIVTTTTPKLVRLRLRLLALLCVALTLSLSLGTALSASEGVRHELDVAQAGSAAETIICLGNDQSCGLPDRGEGRIVPHLHLADLGYFALPSAEPVNTVHSLVSVRFQLPPHLAVDGLGQPTAERPPRSTCI
jgi:hypothetical protein